MYSLLLTHGYKIKTSPCCGGFQYHYEINGERRTSFNYWPTRYEALSAARSEINSHIEFMKNMLKIQKHAAIIEAVKGE